MRLGHTTSDLPWSPPVQECIQLPVIGRPRTDRPGRGDGELRAGPSRVRCVRPRAWAGSCVSSAQHLDLALALAGRCNWTLETSPRSCFRAVLGPGELALAAGGLLGERVVAP